MEVKELKLQLPTESLELGEGVAAILAAVRKSLADGWQPGTDLPQIISESVLLLIPAINGLDQLDDEAKEAPLRLALSLVNPIALEIEKFLKEKKEVV